MLHCETGQMNVWAPVMRCAAVLASPRDAEAGQLQSTSNTDTQGHDAPDLSWKPRDDACLSLRRSLGDGAERDRARESTL